MDRYLDETSAVSECIGRMRKQMRIEFGTEMALFRR